MNSIRDQSHFSGAGIDTRQVSTLQNPTTTLTISSGIIDEWSNLFNSGNSPLPERLMGEAMTERFPLHLSYATKTTSATNRDYELTWREVTALLYVEEDEDFVHPTQYALDFTLSLLENANAELVARSTHFPRGTSATSEWGGIYLFWEQNGKSIQLEVPPKNGGMLYIHCISSDGSALSKDVSAATLADALAMLTRSRKLGVLSASASAR